ncbi:MAG: transcriptional repressor [Desulfatibacillaceae bacterium]|nr:transcriptional repressor [Desulfatibacillaceae bacterium]
MQTNPKNNQNRLERFQETLKKSGIKMTVQRMEVFRELAGTGSHPDAETIFLGVRQKIPMISLDTVYRTLWLFIDLGLVSAVGQSKERARFDANTLQHHHFICRQCGRMQDFYSDRLNSLALPDSIEKLGLAEKTQVEVLGLCAGCLSKTDNP